MAFTCRVQYLDDTDPFASTVFPEPTRPPSFTFNEYLPLVDQLQAVHKFLKAPHKLEDCTLQLSHNGYYLDLDSSIDEQKDDFEHFNKERKHSIILRSQLSVRVHGCIEKLLNSSGRELRRALFSLKQIFQDDKDLVHEFVSADGLACLIKVGTDADQNYQNYILRALGQIMLYVDGMNGVIEHTDTVQWLYSLLASRYRLVVKTSLKLLLVFVEYTDTNAAVLYQATCVVDKEQGKSTWANVMELLKEDGQDSEILLYTMSLINKTLNAIPDQDTFYDITDSLEQQQIEETTKQLTSLKGTDLDLVEQFQLYEYALKQEDGDIDIPVERKHNLRKHRRSAELADRKSLRRSLKPTPEYGGDRRELRRSLDLGMGLSPDDARRVNEASRKRENRKSRSRFSVDNSALSTSPPSEKTVKDLMEERKMRRRAQEQEGSSREDTSAATTDMSASENSSTKFPWRRGRSRQPPGQLPPAEGGVVNATLSPSTRQSPQAINIKQEGVQGEQGELQRVLAERRQRRREMRQKKEEEGGAKPMASPSSSVSPGRSPSASMGGTSNESRALQEISSKAGTSLVTSRSRGAAGDDQQKMPPETQKSGKSSQDGGSVKEALVKGQSSLGSDIDLKKMGKEQTTSKSQSTNQGSSLKERGSNCEQEGIRSKSFEMEGNLEDIKEELEENMEQDPLELLSKGDLRYDPYMDASSETGASFTPIYPSSSTSSLAAFSSVTPTTEGSDVERESTNVSDSEGYLTLPSEEDADSHTPIAATDDDTSGRKVNRPKFFLSEVSVTSVKSSDSDTAGKRRDAATTRNRNRETEDEDDILMLLSMGDVPPGDALKDRLTVDSKEQDEVSWLSEGDTRCSSSEFETSLAGGDEVQCETLPDEKHKNGVGANETTTPLSGGNFSFKFAQSQKNRSPSCPSKKDQPAQDDEEDLMALLSQGCLDLASERDHRNQVPDSSRVDSDTDADVPEIDNDSDWQSSGEDLTPTQKNLPKDGTFVQTYYESPAKSGKAGSLSSTQKLAKTTYIKKDGISDTPESELITKTPEIPDQGQRSKQAQSKKDENELMALLAGGIPNEKERSVVIKQSTLDTKGRSENLSNKGDQAVKKEKETSSKKQVELKHEREDEDVLSLLSQGFVPDSKEAKQMKNSVKDDDVIAMLSQGFEPVPGDASENRDRRKGREEEEEDVLSMLSQGFAPPISEPERTRSSTSHTEGSDREVLRNQSRQEKLKDTKAERQGDRGRVGRQSKTRDEDNEEDVLAMLGRGVPGPSPEEAHRNQSASQTFHQRFREVPENERSSGRQAERTKRTDNRGQRSRVGEEVSSPNWRTQTEKPKFRIRSTYDDPPVPSYTSRNRKASAGQYASTPSSSPWSAHSNETVFSPYRTFTPSSLLYGGEDSASKWLDRANPQPIKIPSGNRSLQHFDRPRKSSQSVASESAASPVVKTPVSKKSGIFDISLDDDVFAEGKPGQPAVSTEDSTRSSELITSTPKTTSAETTREPNQQKKTGTRHKRSSTSDEQSGPLTSLAMIAMAKRKGFSGDKKQSEEEELLRLLSGGDTKPSAQSSKPSTLAFYKSTTPSYKSTPTPDSPKPSADSNKPSYKSSSTSGRDSRPAPSSYPSPSSSSSYKPSSRLPPATSSVSSPYSSKGKDALPSRNRPVTDTTSTTTTPSRTKPDEDTPWNRARPSTDDTPSRVRPTVDSDTPTRRRYGRDSAAAPETPTAVSSPAPTSTNTTPSTPTDTDYITERRRRRREREAQRAAEAEAAEKLAATLPRNFKPADSSNTSTPLTTTEYVSHRRRKNKDEVAEETVSTTVTARKPAEVVSPPAVENGDISSSHRRRRRRSSSKAEQSPTENKEPDMEDVKPLMPPDYLSGGIAARRKMRQEQREREQAEKKEKENTESTGEIPVPIIVEPSSTSEEDTRGQRSLSKTTGLSNGDSSGLEPVTSETSRTSSPDRSATSDDTVQERTVVPKSISNHVEPSHDKTAVLEGTSEKPSSQETKEPPNLRVDTTAARTAGEGDDTPAKPQEETSKVGQETPMSAGLSSNKRYQLAMMYSSRNSQDEATVNSPSRKISTSLQDNDTITSRIDQLTKGQAGDEDEGLTMTVPKNVGVTEGTVQSVQEKLQSLQKAASEEQKPAGPTGDTTGAINLAKQGLKSINIPVKQPGLAAPSKSGAVSPEAQQDAQWEEILRQNNRELRIGGWDFTDLSTKDDKNVFTVINAFEGEGVVPPPPPPPMGGVFPPPPPAPAPPAPPMGPGHYGTLPPPPPPISQTSISDGYNTYPPKKKKTVRLFWKETRLDRLAMYGKKDPKDTIWGALGEVKIDKRKLEHLFESKAKDILQKKILEAGKKHVISVLDAKRSNHINIALTALPHPGTIKQAILKMDGTAVNKEGIEKLLTMVPTEEESNLIKESTMLNPDIPLGSAEQFLHMLSNITVLKARLNLWLFKMDYESMEEEVAEPLAELKKGIEDLKNNQTFRHILSMLLAVGNFLNGAQVQGFHIDYLAKVPDIKDTVHKQSLLYHLCTMVIEQFPESTDLFSELASVSRCAKVDFEVLDVNLQKMEEQCKASWEHLRIISKHDSHSPLKNKLQDFLADCAQRIIVLKIVHRRVLNRFNKLLLYLGMTASAAREMKITEFCKIISEFALEYRTTRERVLEQEKKKANHRKRAMTRGKMITENLTLSQDKEEDAKLKALLKNHVGTAPGDETLKTRTRNRPTLARQSGMDLDVEVNSDNPGTDSPGYDDTDAAQSTSTANMEDVGDEQTDEMLQILVNTAKNTKTRNTPRERKRGRTNRKSLRRTLKGGTGLTEAESLALGLHPACKTVQV